MENLEPDRRSRMGILDKKKKINPRNLSLKSKMPVENRSDQSTSCKLYDPNAGIKAMKSTLIAQNTASTSRHGMSDDVAASSKDDSLKDFRSPVKEIDMNESLADFKVSVPSKRLAQKESKPIVKKKRLNRDVLSDVKQPSIESSFFRTKTEVQTSFVCPLCYKSYKDLNARTNHMKGCAAWNNISTKQLLDALKLQEKQAEERKAMGLLVAPPVQLKKNVSRKMISDKDPQLQLALALSMSLHEAQVTEEIEEAHLLVGEPYSPINGEMSEERRKTLQNFGFTTNKPMVASTGNKSRKKRPAGPTVLQTRTQEERDRITTVRIAEVLMGDEPITQALLKNKEEEIVEPVESINLKSRLLQSYHCVEDRLWDKTKQTMNDQSSYPHNNHLESSPCKTKSESNVEKKEQKLFKQETPTDADNNPAGISGKDNVSARVNLESSSESSTDDDDDDNDDAVSVKCKVDQDSVIDLSKDWRCMLGASYMSDVLVVVKEDCTIFAHQVVFWARCYSLMDDVTENDPDRLWERKYRVSWPETEIDSAYAFLEYVYCGNIESHVAIFDDPEMLAGVRALARKYRLKKLFDYLRNKSNELKSKAARIPKTRIDLKSRLADTSDDSSRSLNRVTSICSKETDINSPSIECNDSIIDERDYIEKISAREHSRSTEEREKENMSAFSSLKVNSSTSNNRLSGKRMSQETPTSIAATVTDSRGSQGLPKSDLTPRKETILGTQNNAFLKVINDETLERERSVSPDIFDDSESENATSNNAVSKGHCHNFEHEMNENDAQVEFLCSSEEIVRTEGGILLDQEISVADTVANISKEGDRKSLEKLKIDFPFVSTRRTRRNFKNSFSADDSNREKSLSGSFPKQKGEITLAIEKMQKLNSKTASESDSECESVEAFRIKKRRNPFRLNITESSSVVEENIEHDANSESDGSSHWRRRNKLSLFEKKIEIAAEKNPSMFNLPGRMSDVGSKNTKPSESTECIASTSGLQNTNLRNQNDTFNDESIIEPSQKLAPRLDDSDDSIFDLTKESSRESKSDSDKDTCDTNTDDKDLSMFTKYKRKNSRNSIEKYRAAIRNASLATSVSSSKGTGSGRALSSNDSKISDSELSDPTDGVNYINFSSKYEYTDPNQSRSNFHRELLSMSAKSKEHIDISRQILSSTESKDREQQSTVNLGDAEFSDFEIASSDFPSLRYSDEFSESKSVANRRSQGESISTKKSDNETLDDEQTRKDGTAEIVDVPSYSVNVKLEETEIRLTQGNLSEEETDTECWIESVEPKNGKQFAKEEEKLTDICNEETDTEETGERSSKARTSRSKTEVNNTVNDDSKKIPNAQPLVEDGSSSECEITGEFQSASMDFDFIKNVSDEIGHLLEECKRPSQSLHNLSMSQLHNNSGPSVSDSFVSSPAHRLDGNNYGDITPPNFVNAYEDDTFLADHNFSEAHCSNQNLGGNKSRGVKKTGESSKVSTKKIYSFSESDSSDFEDLTTRKTKDRTSFSSENKSKTMKASAGSTSPIFGSVSPEKNSSLSLRTFKTKSISENILKSTSMSKTNRTKNSFDRKFTIARTSSADHDISKRIDRTTPQREDVPSENVTPLADYSAMKTPELRKELDKYGFKPQKRHRAKQLLRYIYNELHPLVPVSDTKIPSYSNISSSDDEIPAPKRLNKSKSLEAVNNKKCEDNAELDQEMLASNTRTESEPSDYEELENYDHYNLSQSDDSKSLENHFRQLIEVDKDLYNKVLTYEPLELEKLHSTLKSQGLKCKLNALMSFLDEQCITFRQMTNAKKSRTRRKVNSQKNQNTR